LFYKVLREKKAQSIQESSISSSKKHVSAPKTLLINTSFASSSSLFPQTLSHVAAFDFGLTSSPARSKPSSSQDSSIDSSAVLASVDQSDRQVADAQTSSDTSIQAQAIRFGPVEESLLTCVMFNLVLMC
jgi:hypothetical protein